MSKSTEQKLYLLSIIRDKKDILWGSFDNTNSRALKRQAWTDIFSAAVSIGFPMPKNADYTYIRDVFWPNIRRPVMVL